MSKSSSGHFKGTKGEKNFSASACTKKKKIPKLFRDGHITFSGVSAHREKFMTKSIRKIVKLLQKHGYKVEIAKSKRANLGSKAKIIKSFKRTQHHTGTSFTGQQATRRHSLHKNQHHRQRYNQNH